MWKLWLLFDTRQAILTLWLILATMVMINHFFVLSSDRYTFLNDAKSAKAAQQRSALPAK